MTDSQHCAERRIQRPPENPPTLQNHPIPQPVHQTLPNPRYPWQKYKFEYAYGHTNITVYDPYTNKNVTFMTNAGENSTDGVSIGLANYYGLQNPDDNESWRPVPQGPIKYNTNWDGQDDTHPHLEYGWDVNRHGKWYRPW